MTTEPATDMKRRARAVAMAAISDDDVRRDPARAFEIALGAARGFIRASRDARTDRNKADRHTGSQP